MDDTELLPDFLTNSESFEYFFKENQRLFFEPDSTDENGECQTVNSDQIPEAATIDINEPSETSDIAPNYPRRIFRSTAVRLGGIIIASAAVITTVVEIKPSQPQNSAPSVPSVSLTGLPKKLPAAVKADLNNVGRVDIEVYASQNIAATSVDYVTEQWASAVEVKSGLVLTAGHLMDSPSDKINSSTECQQVTFSNSIQRDFLVSEYSTTSSNPVPSIPDLGVITLPQPPNYEATYGSFRNITIAPKPPKVGEKLFFVNEEPEINRTSAGSYGYQSIYVGVYAGETSYDDYEVITGLKSYGQTSNKSSIGGSSGGAVLNGKGQLVGLSVRASDNSANNEIVKSYSVEQYAHWDGVRYTGLKPSSEVTDSVVQPVTQSLISHYVGREHAIAQNCFPEGGQE